MMSRILGSEMSSKGDGHCNKAITNNMSELENILGFDLTSGPTRIVAWWNIRRVQMDGSQSLMVYTSRECGKSEG
jgi:hypothetical protein